MVLKGVDEIDWFTDRPYREEGIWKPQKLLRKWDKYFATSEPNAQATVEVDKQRDLFTFEMFKPKLKSRKMIFNIKPLSESLEDKIAGIAGKPIDSISLFIDNASTDNSPLSSIAGQVDKTLDDIRRAWGASDNQQNLANLIEGLNNDFDKNIASVDYSTGEITLAIESNHYDESLRGSTFTLLPVGHQESNQPYTDLTSAAYN